MLLGAPAADEEWTDVKFALIVTQLNHEARRGKFHRLQRRATHSLICLGLVLVALNSDLPRLHLLQPDPTRRSVVNLLVGLIDDVAQGDRDSLDRPIPVLRGWWRETAAQNQITAAPGGMPGDGMRFAFEQVFRRFRRQSSARKSTRRTGTVRSVDLYPGSCSGSRAR